MSVDAVSELFKKGHDVKFFCLTGSNGQDELYTAFKQFRIERKIIDYRPSAAFRSKTIFMI